MFSNKLEKIGFCTLTVCEHKVVKSCRRWFTLLLGVETQLLGGRGTAMALKRVRKRCVFERELYH